MLWEHKVRKKDLIQQYGLTQSEINLFERDCPNSWKKMNGDRRNSPKQYDLDAVNKWWDKQIRTQAQARKMKRRVV